MTYTQAQATFPSGAIVEEPTGVTPEASIPVDTCVNETKEPIQANYGMYIPAEGASGLEPSLVYVVADPSKPPVKKCTKLAPFYPPKKPTTPCLGTPTTSVCGPISFKMTPGLWQDNGKITVDVSGELAVEINKIFNIGIKAGLNVVSDLKIQILTYTASQKCDVYKCVNGAWVYLYSQLCSRQATGVVTIPSWYYLAIGYPAGGGPGAWTPWVCSVVGG